MQFPKSQVELFDSSISVQKRNAHWCLQFWQSSSDTSPVRVKKSDLEFWKGLFHHSMLNFFINRTCFIWTSSRWNERVQWAHFENSYFFNKEKEKREEDCFFRHTDQIWCADFAIFCKFLRLGFLKRTHNQNQNRVSS